MPTSAIVRLPQPEFTGEVPIEQCHAKRLRAYCLYRRALLGDRARLAARIEGGDLVTFKPLPMVEWRQTEDRDECGRCSFLRVCRPEAMREERTA